MIWIYIGIGFMVVSALWLLWEIKNAPTKIDDQYYGKFVTANLKGKKEPRQGWVISTLPFKIQGESGTIYECEGEPTIVINPPTK